MAYIAHTAPIIASEIVTAELAKTEWHDIAVSESDFWIDDNPKFIYPNDPFNNFSTQILERASKDRFGSTDHFMHFNKPDRIIDVLHNKRIIAANLPAHSRNDSEEYSAFMRVVGRNEWFYEQEEDKGDKRWFSGYGNRRIDDWRAGVHILCFTNSESDRMWIEYAGTKENPAIGAALVFSLEDFDHSEIATIQPMYDFRNIAYDNKEGTRFNFFSSIEEQIQKATGKALLFSRIPRFAKFYKRNGYLWENETRLAFDSKYVTQSFGRSLYNAYDVTGYDGSNGGNPWIALSLPIFEPTEPRDVIHPFFNFRVGLKSPHFKLVLRRVILGKNMTSVNRQRISELIERKFPSVDVETR